MLLLSRRANSEATLFDSLSLFVGFGNREARSSVSGGMFVFLRRKGNHDDILAVIVDEGEGVKLSADVRVWVLQAMADGSPFYGVVIGMFVCSLSWWIFALLAIGQANRSTGRQKVLVDKCLSLYRHCVVRQHTILRRLRVGDKQGRPQVRSEQDRIDVLQPMACSS